ncbi:MAG: histidine phosphatase family protein [Pseudomonadota bacterium]
MITRRLFVIFALLILAVPSWAQKVAIPDGTTLIILRHADRSGEDLNALGRARAEALVAALDGIDIDHIFSPSIQRNLDTAAPLATARGMEIERIAAGKPAAKLISEGAGKTIIWIGNKGNLKSIWDDLGAPGNAPLMYGDLFFVTPGPVVERRVVAP